MLGKTLADSLDVTGITGMHLSHSKLAREQHDFVSIYYVLPQSHHLGLTHEGKDSCPLPWGSGESSPTHRELV